MNKTGWPPPPLAQDDNRALSLWFAARACLACLRKGHPKLVGWASSEEGENVNHDEVICAGMAAHFDAMDDDDPPDGSLEYASWFAAESCR